jgi:hypothetical protein
MDVNHARIINHIKALINKTCEHAVFTPDALKDTMLRLVRPYSKVSAFNIAPTGYDNNRIEFSITLQPTRPVEFVTLTCTIISDILPYKAYFIKKDDKSFWVTCTDRDVSSPDYEPYVAVFGRTVGNWALYDKSLEMFYFTPNWVEIDKKPDIDGINLTTRNIVLKKNVEAE